MSLIALQQHKNKLRKMREMFKYVDITTVKVFKTKVCFRYASILSNEQKSTQCNG